MEMIEIKNGGLTMAGEQVFHSLSFAIGKGCIVGVKASHPCVATMLAECFIGLRGLDEGFVSMDGEPLLPRTAKLFRPQMAYIPRCVRMPLATVAELFDTLIDLSVNDEMERPKKKFLAEWHKTGIDTELYNARMDDVGDYELLLMMLAAANISARPVIVIDSPTITMDDQQTDHIVTYIREMAHADRAILIVNGGERILAVCDKTVDLDEYHTTQHTD